MEELTTELDAANPMQVQDRERLKLAERELQTKETLMADVLDAFDSHVAVIDSEGVIIAVNQAWKRFAIENNSRDEYFYLGANYLTACQNALSHSCETRGTEAVLHGIRSVLNGGNGSFTLEYPCHAPDTKRWFSVSVSPLKGSPGGAVISHTDISDRKQAEQDLRIAESLFKEFAENADAIFWVATPDFRNTLYISDAYERIMQRPCREILADPKSLFEAVHPEDRSLIRKAIKKNQNQGWKVEFRIIRPDGSVRWIRNWAFPLTGASGTVLRMGGIAEDITEAKRMQQEAEYRHQQIIHADKLAALGEVVAGVAHEINNPNSFITYNIPLLKQTWKVIEPIVLKYARAHPEWNGSELSLEELCEDMRGIIHDIQGGSDRINRIVKDLKDFARLEETGHARPVQVNDVIEKTMTIVGAQLRKYAAKIVQELEVDLPEVEGHFNKLEQVVANLLVNAAHAIKGKEDGKLIVSTRYVERLDAVLIVVEDNGAGISQEAMDRIFDPFFTTRRGDGGTGLGLSVSYGLIEEHRGTISVLSRPGKGSRFTVYLPVDRTRRLELKPTILYVDDDPIFLGMLRTRFFRVNQYAEGLRSSEDVMVYLREHPEVDIVFSDLVMPNVNGWELLAKVKEQYPLLTFIIYSGDPSAVEGKPEDTPPPDYLLEKPFSMKILGEIINRIGRQRI